MRFLVVSLVVLAFAGCSRNSGKVEISARELNPAPDTKAPAEPKTVDETELGLTVYPDAKTPKGMAPMLRSSVPDFEKKVKWARVDVWLESPDKPDQIEAYYRPQLSGCSTEKTALGSTLEGLNRKAEKTVIILTRKPDATLTSIAITVTKNIDRSMQSPAPPP